MIFFELLIPQGDHGSLLWKHFKLDSLAQALERVTLLEICVGAEMTAPWLGMKTEVLWTWHSPAAPWDSASSGKEIIHFIMKIKSKYVQGLK